MTRNRLSRSRRNKRYDKLDFKLPETLLRLDWSPDQIVGYLRGVAIQQSATNSFISTLGTTKYSAERYGNTYDNQLKKGVKDTTQKTAEDGWQQSVILRKAYKS